MIPQKRNIFCIIVHFGSQEDTNLLLRQLCSGPRMPKRVVVVDHARVPLVAPSSVYSVIIEIVRPGRNAGYAAGINVGMEALAGTIEPSDVVVCMNNDIQVSSTVLSHVYEQVHEGVIAGHHIWGVNLFSGRTIQEDFSQHRAWYVLP
ncbi:MAG: hypothetical protein COU33_01175, partial [Candidatus Magasanikbacteria bacterium CG10_big_fil_rev_8_21_14_0_10_43_6]